MTHIIHTANGRLCADSNAASIKALIAEALSSNKPILVHFHGGLVGEAKGREIAETMAPKFETNAFPIFYVWESGLLETIQNNLKDIANEEVFNYLLRKVSDIVDRKFKQGHVNRGVNLPPSTQQPDVQGEVAVTLVEPPVDTDQLTPISSGEASDLSVELQFDNKLDIIITAIEATMDNTKIDEDVTTRSATTTIRASGKTLMSPDALARLTNGPDSRGILSIKFISAIINVASRVVKRYISKRAHGVHATIVEEILREFYLTNVGGLIWSQMKKDTADCFGGDPQVFGGTALLSELKAQVGSGQYPRIILTGHSTGAVFISHFLKAADGLLPEKVKFDVVFLAPAVTFKLFEEVAVHVSQRINNIRIFAMQDQYERADILVKQVPFLYPLSLLYFVSGVTETSVDEPIVGMQRFYDPDIFKAGEFPHVETVRQFLSKKAGRSIWSIDKSSGAGKLSDAKSHGDFDQDGPTLASIQHIIASGF